MTQNTTVAIAPAILVANEAPVFVTIDSESTRDIDDALWVSPNTVDGFKVQIAIADPTKLVKVDSEEDVRARRLAATVYQRNEAIKKMLPAAISEDRGSLVAGEKRRSLVLSIDIDHELNVTRFDLAAKKIQVAHRLSYEQIPSILADEESPLRSMLNAATTLARLLVQSRRNRGALALYDLKRMLLTDEEGNLRQFSSAEETIANILIQECMVLSNSLLGQYLVEHNIPAIFRNHKSQIAAPRADELAQTIESWLGAGAVDSVSVQAQFGAILGKARYAATAQGHYGLNLPVYVHGTSPLRRYADLVNMRQLMAYIANEPLPYEQAELEEIAADINEAMDRRQDERSEGFKKIVARTASRAIAAGNVSRLADHELSAAVKLGREAGYLPPALVDELMKRMEQGTLADTVADRLVFELPRSAIPSPLAVVFGRWLQVNPPRAMHLFMHGKQIGWFKSDSIHAEEKDGRFFAVASAVVVETGRHFTAKGYGAKKREAEQSAVVQLIADALDCPLDKPMGVGGALPVSVAAGSAPSANYKGQLLELCQQKRWLPPRFEIVSTGPSHRMVFAASVTLVVDGIQYTGKAEGASGKKEAEAQAAASLLKQLAESIKPSQPQSKRETPPIAGPEDNPVGHLQERAQKKKCGMPKYALTLTTGNPAVFECVLTTYCLGAPRLFTATGGSKTEAKRAAAALAVQSLD